MEPRLLSVCHFVRQVLREFVGLFDFCGVGLVAALRDFLRTFRLPGESQQIERVMEAFSDEYFRQQAVVNCPHNQEKLAEAAAVAASAAGAASPASVEANKNCGPAPEPLELSMWRWVADEGFYCTSPAAATKEGSHNESEKGQHKTSDVLTKQLAEFSPVSSLWTQKQRQEGIPCQVAPQRNRPTNGAIYRERKRERERKPYIRQAAACCGGGPALWRPLLNSM